MKALYPEIVCNDGTTLSVQASELHYSMPKQDNGPYTHYEVGFPSEQPHEAMMEYAEDKDSPLHTVYTYVPKHIVQEFINLHDGIKIGVLP